MLSDSEIAVESIETGVRADGVRAFLSYAARVFASKPFKPHPVLRGGHAQTLAGFAWPRRFRLQHEADEERLFQVTPSTKVLAHCRWQPVRSDHPTVVIWHGMEGSSSSIYMLATAQKFFHAGFNVLRVNLRNCGGTEHLTPTLYHGGLSEDLRAVVDELLGRDGLGKIFLVGFSLGGNLVLKLAGEYGEFPPKEIIAACAVSPSADLSASGDAIKERSNWIYQQDFLRRLKNRLHLKGKLYPELYDTTEVDLVRTVREFDERFTSVAHGFADAADYYYKASAVRVIDQIRLPTLIIHARDDPFIPFAPLKEISVEEHPFILLLAPESGGHVAFIAAKPSQSHMTRSADHESRVEDRFWAENRVVEFCRLANETL